MTSARDLLSQRVSVRAFLPDQVTEETVRDILAAAARSPSGGNVQPWRVRVVTGAAKDALTQAVTDAIAADPFADEGPFPVYPEKLWEPYRSRRYAVGEEMYALLGVPREDKLSRLAWLQQNYVFFGAPVGLFFSLDTRMHPNQWAHLGMFMQSVALAALDHGLATCMQEAWMVRAKTVSRVLNLEPTEQLYCGMALGRPDPDAAVNRLRTSRAAVDEFAEFSGF